MAKMEQSQYFEVVGEMYISLISVQRELAAVREAALRNTATLEKLQQWIKESDLKDSWLQWYKADAINSQTPHEVKAGN